MHNKGKKDKDGTKSLLVGPELSAIGILNAALGVIRTDQKITGFDVPVNQQLVNAVANARNSHQRETILPSEIAAYSDRESKLGKDAATIAATLPEMESCVEKNKDSVSATDKAAVARVRATFDALTTAKDGATPLLQQALRLATLVEQGKLPDVLRVRAEKLGGSTIVRSNIFLQLGFPGAVVIRGGVVASWRLVDPHTGAVKGAGVVACLTADRNLRNVVKVTGTTWTVLCRDKDGKWTSYNN